MKTYPYATDEGIIDLVRKDEHDAAVAKWQAEASRLSAEREHNANMAGMWQAVAGQLAEELKCCKNRAMDKSIETHADDHAKGCIDDIWEWSENALAAYESAKSGNPPDPLVEAVKRMEAVAFEEMDAAFLSTLEYRASIERIRACLIQAAKGEQL